MSSSRAARERVILERSSIQNTIYLAITYPLSPSYNGSRTRLFFLLKTFNDVAADSGRWLSRSVGLICQQTSVGL